MLLQNSILIDSRATLLLNNTTIYKLELKMIDTKLLEILACPACRGDLEYDTRNEKLLCTGCGLKYPVKDGIPVMLVDEAEKPEK